MKRNILIAAFLTILCSCSTVLTPLGNTVRIIENKDNYECKFLGTVSGFDTFGSTVGKESENALNEARNKAAQLGANTIKMIHMQTTFQGTSVMAEALLCTFPDDD